MDPAKAKAHRVPAESFSYTQRDAIIYALGIGATTKKDLRYLYENDEDFGVFPTFVVAPGLLANGLGSWPGVEFDLTRILHGEQYIEWYAPLPTDAKLKSDCRVVDILDKGSGALIISEITTYDAVTNEKLCMQQFGTFQVGSGNFGGARTSPSEKQAATIPKRAPDQVVEQKTDVDQATLYRLGSGDLNPLHIDPNFAKMSGFKEPILHGLCSLGFATRHVVATFADNDASRLKAIKVRFSAPVLPGQTLRTEMWRADDGKRVIFQAKVKETDKVVLSSSWVEFDRLSGGTGAAPTQTTETTSNSNSDTKMTVQSARVFEVIGKELPGNQDTVKQIKAIIFYDITQNGKSVAKYTIDLKNGTGSVYEGEPKEKAAVSVTIDDDDFLKIINGELEPTKAFMSGKLKAKGNVMILQKLKGVIGQAKSKL